MQNIPRRTESDPERVRRLLLCLDGLRYSFAVCFSSYSRVIPALRKFETAELAAPTNEVVQVMTDIWSLVDAIHRIRMIVEQMPIFDRKHPIVRTFKDGTQAIERLRHYVQHLNREIGKVPPSAPPLWGSLSWQAENDETKCFTLVTSSMHLAQSVSSLVVDRHERKFVRRIEFSAANTMIDLEDLLRRLRSLHEAVRTWANTISFADGTAYNFDPDFVPIICTTIAFRASELPPESC